MLHVLDASAMLALILDEPGAEAVMTIGPSAVIGSVNLSEVAAVLVRRGGEPDQVRRTLAKLAVPVLAADEDLALEAGLLWAATKAAGASLGDRFALALALRLGGRLVTSDSRLADVSRGLAAEVLSIR